MLQGGGGGLRLQAQQGAGPPPGVRRALPAAPDGDDGKWYLPYSHKFPQTNKTEFILLSRDVPGVPQKGHKVDQD